MGQVELNSNVWGRMLFTIYSTNISTIIWAVDVAAGMTFDMMEY